MQNVERILWRHTDDRLLHALYCWSDQDITKRPSSLLWEGWSKSGKKDGK